MAGCADLDHTKINSLFEFHQTSKDMIYEFKYTLNKADSIILKAQQRI